MIISDRKPARLSLAILRIALVVITFIVLAPVMRADFGGWDDALNVAENPRLLPPTLANIRYYWTHAEADLYIPLTYTLWSAVAYFAYAPAIPGTSHSLSPGLFHLLNLMLHALAGLACFEILRRCVQSALAAGAGALLFALHPIQVEAVAWVAGMKDLLSGMLALVAIWQYLDAAASTRRSAWWIRFALATLAFVAAMFAKPSAVVTPVITSILIRYALRRSWRDAILLMLPAIVLAIPCLIWTRLAQPAAAVGDAVPLLQRPLVAGDAIAFYLWKLIWPAKLGVDYGHTPGFVLAQASTKLIWLVPVGLIVTAFLLRGRAPMLLAAVLIFLVALLPVLGFVAFDFQAYSTVADHYLYLAMLGPAILFACLLSRYSNLFMWSLATILLITIAITSRLQTRHWQNGIVIFKHAIDVNPQSWVSNNQLAVAYSRQGDRDRALKHARAATELNPAAISARFTYATALAGAGFADEAIEAYRALLVQDPHHVAARVNLANLLADSGQPEAAIDQYELALLDSPQNTLILTNLAGVLAEAGRFEQAISNFRKALEINPNNQAARIGLQKALADRATSNPVR